MHFFFYGELGSKADCGKGGVPPHSVSTSSGSWHWGLHSGSHCFHSFQRGWAPYSSSLNEYVHAPFHIQMICNIAITIGCPSCGWKCCTCYQQALCNCREPKRILNSEEILVSSSVLVDALESSKRADLDSYLSFITWSYIYNNVRYLTVK